jgi:hypothetical protein
MTMATPLYIFDLDGTLADLKHRRHFVDGTDGKKNWDAFHAACVDDTPIIPVIDLLLGLTSNNEIWIWSGRMITVASETSQWLRSHVGQGSFSQLRMRPSGDYTPDHILKEQWLHAMSPSDRARLVMVLDDRQRVVDMWRRNGVVCAQVAPGDF